ncbi:MAG: phenylalanine--tRNA ligase subunit beta [Chloroflexi bacterium]|nr:phenylalanine--tRNA ligase subunit beta [Chloroflexota bacterium]
MKVPLSWLRDYVPLTLPAKELAEKLTMAGLEVTGMEVRGGGWEKVWVGQVVEVSPHPNADRLKLVTVDLGTSRETVVSGAPNLRVGDKVPFARVGARLIDGHTGQPLELKPVKIRGVASAGMVCSEKELGLSDQHEGIMVLPSEAPVGVPLSQYLGDTILDIDITPNRPDCLSVLGVAWEVAARTGQRLSLPPSDYPEEGLPIEGLASAEIRDPDLCPRYSAALVLGVKVGPSPSWLRERLEAYGMRPINNVVDITNYVMIEMGQPLHAFDFDTLRGRKIIVRRARQGEKFTTLDGVEWELNPQMLVIADAERAVALGGIMGGLDTEVTPSTTAVLLEAASFAFPQIRATSRALGLDTEAVMRFGRGLAPGLTVPALRRAVKLILDLAGGKAAPGHLDTYPGRKGPESIFLPHQEIKRLLGVELVPDEVERILTSLGFECLAAPSGLQVRVPHWRSDIRLAADLVEEVARLRGYDQVPLTLVSGPPPSPRPNPMLQLKERLRDLLVALGLQEAITYALVSAERLEAAKAPLGIRVANPLTREQEYLRTSLRPGLFSLLAQNQKHDELLRFFELGRVYLPREKDLPVEREMAGVVVVGRRRPLSWAEKEETADFYDIKGLAQELLSRLGLEPQFLPGRDPSLHPARQAYIAVAGNPIGLLGEVHPHLAEAFELKGPAYLLELDLAGILPHLPPHRPYRPLARFPAVLRDIALVVDEGVPAEKVEGLIRANPLVLAATLFDVYTGKPVPPGKKSLAFRLEYQSLSRTLTDEEVDQALGQALARLKQELGADLRT